LRLVLATEAKSTDTFVNLGEKTNKIKVHKSLRLKAKPLSLLPIQEADSSGFG
jgi:hypothetical protein